MWSCILQPNISKQHCAMMLPTTTIKPNDTITTFIITTIFIITTTIIPNPPIPSFPPPTILPSTYHPSVDPPPPLLCLALSYPLRDGAPSECNILYPYLHTHPPAPTQYFGSRS